MSKALIFFALTISILSMGCGSAPTANSSQNSSQNSNVVVNASQKDLPPGMSTSPVPPSANTTPGIPPSNAVTNVSTGNATGINPKNAVRTMKPGEKIPGIPDAATMKKQMSQPVDPSKLPPEFRNAMKSSNANTPTMTKSANTPPSMTKKPQ